MRLLAAADPLEPPDDGPDPWKRLPRLGVWNSWLKPRAGKVVRRLLILARPFKRPSREPRSLIRPGVRSLTARVSDTQRLVSGSHRKWSPQSELVVHAPGGSAHSCTRSGKKLLAPSIIRRLPNRMAAKGEWAVSPYSAGQSRMGLTPFSTCFCRNHS